MSTYQCPKGHISTEPDYCSECGSKINGASKVALAVPPTAEAVITCPDCSTPHEPDSGNFCEICGYNFATGAHGEVPIAPTPIVNKIETPISNTSTPTSRQTAFSIEVIVTIDPALREAESPPAPRNQPPIIFKLDRSNNLIGRRSEMRGINPEIPLNFDDAVSHRHALLMQQPDGTVMVRDISSSNGTKLNGVELQPMIDVLLQDGDELTVGHWTRIKVKIGNG